MAVMLAMALARKSFATTNKNETFANDEDPVHFS